MILVVFGIVDIDSLYYLQHFQSIFKKSGQNYFLGKKAIN